MPSPVQYFTSMPRHRKSSPTTTTMSQSMQSPETASLHSEYTTYSYDKPDSQPEMLPQPKSKGSWRQRLKKTLKEVGYPPTYFYDLEHGTTPKHGYYYYSGFLPQQPSRL